MLGRGGYGNEDRSYKVGINELLNHLEKNRTNHKEIVEEAQTKFREMAIAELDRMLEEAKSGKPIRMAVGLKVPSIHVREYDNAIGLLEMTQRAGETHTEITADEYERFVTDCWEWRQEFAVSNAAYTDKVG